MGQRVEWDGDWSACGRFVIHSEQVRGEPRWYWLVYRDAATAEVAQALKIDGATDKRVVRRRAQRVADHLARGGTTTV